MLTTVLFLLSLSLILSGLIYFNYDNYFNNNSNNNNNSNYNNSSNSTINISNTSTSNSLDTSNININKTDDDNGDRSIAVEIYQTEHVIINNGSFTFQYHRRSLFTVNDTLFSSIDALLSDDYNFIITEASEDNDMNVNVQFLIIAITHTGDESEVERMIDEDLDYIFSSGYLSQQASIEPIDFQLSEWRIESLDEFNYSSSMLPSTVFNIKVPSYFYFLGDWGKGGNDGDIININSNRKLGNSNNNKNKVTYTYQAAIARAMNSQANFNKPTAIISLGDNIYNSGVSSTTDSLWNSLWRDVYYFNGNGNTNLQGVKWFPVLGNHDYGSASGVQAQIDRTLATDDNEWYFPARNYTITFLLPDNSKVFIVFIDTTTLNPSETSATNSKGGISTSVQEYRIKDQLNHIETNLKNIQNEMDQRNDWLFIAGHYPVFSSGQHGDISENIQYLLPLLESYPVHAYISGHDHMSMHLLNNEGGCHYFVAGAGSMTDSLGTTSKAKLLFAGEKYPAFMMSSINKYEAKFSFINHKSEVTYSYTLKKSMFKNYNAFDNYVYYTSLKNTNTDSISGAILFLILLLFLYFMFSKSQQKKPFESLLLIAETKKTKTAYVSVMKHDNCELDI